MESGSFREFITFCSCLITERRNRSRVVTGRGGAWRRVGGVSGHLNPGGQQFRDDNGAADPYVTAALAAYQAGQASEQAALTALAAARLLVPVVAVLADDPTAKGDSAAQGDKNSE